MHGFAYLFQMTIYVFFPVALFYYFNRPEFQRKALEEKKVVINQSNYQGVHMLFTISPTVESALPRRKCKPGVQIDACGTYQVIFLHDAATSFDG